MGNYSPAEHDQRCDGELIDCEDAYKDNLTAYLYVCWTCRLYWEFLPEWLDRNDEGTIVKLGAASRLQRAGEIWRRFAGEDGILRLAILPIPQPGEEAA